MNDIKSRPIVGTKRANQFYQQGHFTRNNHHRKFDRSLLPAPEAYYNKEFPKLKIKSEWVKVHCCFHDDSTPSLSINMVDGHYRCFACGIKGGDVLAFHRLRYGLNFVDAVNHFGAWKHE
jgi:hypothetical protein